MYVITSRQRYDDPDALLPGQEVVHGIQVHRIWTSRFGRVFLPGRAVDYLTFYMNAGWCLLRLARADDVIVAKTDPPMSSIVAGWVARKRGAHLVNWLQDLFPEVAMAFGIKGLGGWFGRWLVKVRNGSLNRASVNVAIGERMRDRLIEEGIDREKVRVIHNWADGTAIVPIRGEDSDGEGWRIGKQGWGLEGKFIVGYSGNLGRVHDFSTILDAAEELVGEEGIVFLIIGGGPKLLWVRGEVSARRLKNVLFKPYQPRELLGESLGVPDVHLVSLLPAMEGLIVPSKFYGIAAAGRPTLFVGDPNGEVPRLLLENVCGATVQIGDGIGLAMQIRTLASSPELVQDMGGNARRLFEERFEMKIAMGKWESVIRLNGV